MGMAGVELGDGDNMTGVPKVDIPLEVLLWRLAGALEDSLGAGGDSFTPPEDSLVLGVVWTSPSTSLLGRGSPFTPPDSRMKGSEEGVVVGDGEGEGSFLVGPLSCVEGVEVVV